MNICEHACLYSDRKYLEHLPSDIAGLHGSSSFNVMQNLHTGFYMVESIH